jgi:hypothetical protein
MVDAMAPFASAGVVNVPRLAAHVLQFGFGIKNPAEFLQEPPMAEDEVPQPQAMQGQLPLPMPEPAPAGPAAMTTPPPANPMALSGVDPSVLAALSSRLGFDISNTM